MAERRRWCAYRKFETEDVRAFGEGALLAVSIEDALRDAWFRGIILTKQPTAIVWQYFAEQPKFDGTDHMFACEAEQSRWTTLTLHFDVLDPEVIVDVVPSL
jgi:hypothetical protein